MKTINSKLILASKNVATGDILYTFVLTYPRAVLAEVNTHRMLSRNTASSRAIPAKKLRRIVLDNPFVPVSFGQNQKGMQAGQELSGWRRTAAELVWKGARYPALAAQYALEKLGVHKQITNRLVEPWMWVEQVVTATELDNVFLLRNHHMAEPHFQIIAKQMQSQVNVVKETFEFLKDRAEDLSLERRRWEINSPGGIGTIQFLVPGEWHLPFIDDADLLFHSTQKYQEFFRGIDEVPTGHMVPIGPPAPDWETLKKMSTARCARVSYYLPENGKRSDKKRDIELYERLAVREPGNRDPRHLSPLEHVATPMYDSIMIGNFRGWAQFRKYIPGESGRAQED